MANLAERRASIGNALRGFVNSVSADPVGTVAAMSQPLRRRPVLETGLAATALVTLGREARAEGEGPDYYLSPPNEKGEKHFEINLARGDGFSIGGQPFTTGAFIADEVDMKAGGVCFPYATIGVAADAIRITGTITGDAKVETFSFGPDVAFEDIPGLIDEKLRAEVKTINNEQLRKPPPGGPYAVAEVSGWILGTPRGRRVAIEAGDEGFRRFVKIGNYQNTDLPYGCPAPAAPEPPKAPPAGQAAPAPTTAPTGGQKNETVRWGDEVPFNALNGVEYPFGDSAAWTVAQGWDNKDARTSTFQLRIAPGVDVRVRNVVGSKWHVWNGADTARWDQMNEEVKKRDGVTPTVYTVNSVGDAGVVAGRGWSVEPHVNVR